MNEHRPEPTPAAGPGRPVLYHWMLLALAAEVLALTWLRTPEERFDRFAFQDSGGELVRQTFWRQGLRPTVDFGYLYGLLPMLVGGGWYRLFGLTPGAFRGLMLACSLATAWGLARFAGARRLGAAGLALVVLAVPDALQTNAISMVHNLEPALLVHALAEHARGRRATALAVVTACVFVKPSMAYFYGLFLVVALALRSVRVGGWLRSLAPAAATGLVLAAGLAMVFGPGPVVNTLFPVSGISAYRDTGYGFFRGTGRDFWVLRGAGVRDYFRYEVGFWLLGTLTLTWGGLSALVRLARRRGVLDDELVACCAGMHAAFVCLFFGNRGSWVYYFLVLVLGLAALAQRDRRHAAAVCVLAALLLVNDRSKLAVIRQDRTALQPVAGTLGLWATPAERAEWAKVRELTRGGNAVLLADYEGVTLFDRHFARPVSYFDPGRVQRKFLRRKYDQLAGAGTIVQAVPPDWRGFRFWPELAAALDGCEPAWWGRHYTVYRRTRPPRSGGP